MSDYSTDEERVEALKKWWKDNASAILLGAIFGMAVLAGWRYWQNYQHGRSESASGIFQQVLTKAKDKKDENKLAVEQGGKQIMSQYADTAYASFAAMLLAKNAVDNGDLNTARTELNWVMSNAKQPALKEVARLRLARLSLAEGKADDAWGILTREKMPEQSEQLASYHELKGDILSAQGKTQEARTAYLQALALNSPASDNVQLKLDELGGNVGQP